MLEMWICEKYKEFENVNSFSKSDFCDEMQIFARVELKYLEARYARYLQSPQIVFNYSERHF